MLKFLINYTIRSISDFFFEMANVNTNKHTIQKNKCQFIVKIKKMPLTKHVFQNHVNHKVIGLPILEAIYYEKHCEIP